MATLRQQTPNPSEYDYDERDDLTVKQAGTTGFLDLMAEEQRMADSASDVDWYEGQREKIAKEFQQSMLVGAMTPTQREFAEERARRLMEGPRRDVGPGWFSIPSSNRKPNVR